jgi:hypothetical protein
MSVTALFPPSKPVTGVRAESEVGAERIGVLRARVVRRAEMVNFILASVKMNELKFGK